MKTVRRAAAISILGTLAIFAVFLLCFLGARWVLVTVQNLRAQTKAETAEYLRANELADRFFARCAPGAGEMVIARCDRGVLRCDRWERALSGRMKKLSIEVVGSAIEYCDPKAK